MIFKIKKGNHYCSNWLYKLTHFITFKKTIMHTVMFDDSCRYDLNENYDQVNKLFGVSQYLNPHITSYRIGWRYNELTDKIDLYDYIYYNSIRNIEYIRSVHINSYEIIILKTDIKFKYRLWPYFGGKEVAPHDIEILIN